MRAFDRSRRVLRSSKLAHALKNHSNELNKTYLQLTKLANQEKLDSLDSARRDLRESIIELQRLAEGFAAESLWED